VCEQRSRPAVRRWPTAGEGRCRLSFLASRRRLALAATLLAALPVPTARLVLVVGIGSPLRALSTAP